MTPLHQKMIDAMLLHGFAERTKSSYLYAVFHLATHYHPSPKTLTAEHIQGYFLYLIKDRKLCCYAVAFVPNRNVSYFSYTVVSFIFYTPPHYHLER